ncbi:zinc finger BED domain-containing protein RICESLEEPER 2-like [Vicia villosa]|uniref:zinc finger BED domain-containing protein RICESLEEPER 2-like n=1 Tax=Vicia villosa TaxID=3911 RepID=UPI00273AFD5B|nr:zinc finger BED domain-containing protein RICESLEEPER 2-like [Vicia villosa]
MSKLAKCKQCGSLIEYNGGTSVMLAHFKRCCVNPDNVVNGTMHEPSSSSMENREEVVNLSPSVPKFDQVSRMDLTKMFVAMELPFQKGGLKEVDESVVRIRAAVRYVRRTPSRFRRFKKCIDHEIIGYKGYVPRDCDTRWNSTYLMLKGALKHYKTFTKLEFRDRKYFSEISKDKGVPRPEDWEHVELILPFLKIFNEATERILGSSYVTSKKYMLEVFGVGRSILKMCYSEDEKVRSMAIKMKAKYNKYWGKPNHLNMLLLIAMVLDPRCKMKLVVSMAARIYDSSDAEYLKTKLDSHLKSIFEEYSGREMSRLGSSVNLLSGFNVVNDPYHCAEFYRYPILASIAQEVLAIPISSVASESAFSNGGRFLDTYRSSLTAASVEALICTKDWLKGVVPSFLSIEDLDEIDRVEDELHSTPDAGSCSTFVSVVDY